VVEKDSHLQAPDQEALLRPTFGAELLKDGSSLCRAATFSTDRPSTSDDLYVVRFNMKEWKLTTWLASNKE